MAAFASLKIYYQITYSNPALSVSIVAGSDFMDGTCVTAQWVLCVFGRRKGFLYEWPLAKTVVGTLLIVLLRGLHSILLTLLTFHSQ